MSNRPHIPVEIQREVLFESRHACAVCCLPLPLEFAHIIPWNQAKEHKAENLIALCANCHTRADHERWNASDLRRYKQKPCIVERWEIGPLSGQKKAIVELIINTDPDRMTHKDRVKLIALIAVYYDLNIKDMEIISVEPHSSARVRIKLPSDVAEKLVADFQSGHERLKQIVKELGVISVHREVTFGASPQESKGMNYEKLKKLRQISPITYCLERVFWWLQFASPGVWWFHTRVWVDDQVAKVHDEHEKALVFAQRTKERARKIECYVILWLLVQFGLGIVVASFPATGWSRFARWAALYHVAELLVVAVNMNIFDRIRIFAPQNRVASVERTLVLSVINFVEIWLCFSIAYGSKLENLTNSTGWFDGYYFSAVTQLTIGYGDIAPTGWLRPLAMLQGFLSFLFAIIVLARLVALLPTLQSSVETMNTKPSETAEGSGPTKETAPSRRSKRRR